MNGGPSNPVSGVGAGMRYFFAGMRMLFRQPSLLGLSLAPIIFTVGLLLCLAWGSAWAAGRIFGDWFGEDLRVFAQALALALTLLLGYFLYLPLARILLAPFSEALSRRAHLISTGAPYPKAKMGWGRAILEGLKLVAFQATIIVAAVAAAMVFPPLGAPAGILAAVFTCGLDFLDVPLSARGLPLRRKLGIIFSRKATALGFGLAAYLSLLIPLVNLISLPAGIVGATLLMESVEDA